MLHKLIKIITFCYTFFIALASLGKFALGVLPKRQHSDKIGHLIGYAIFVILWSFYFSNHKNNYSTIHSKIKLKAALFSLIFSFFMELAQGLLTSYRQFDLWDMLANSIGIVIGLLLLSLFLQFFKKRLG